MSRIRLYQPLTNYSLKQKRVTIKLHERWNKALRRHCFRLKNGKSYEGWIDEIQKDRIIFNEAWGIYDQPDQPDIPVEIMIDDIELIVYYSDDGCQGGLFWQHLMATSQSEEPATNNTDRWRPTLRISQ